MKTRVLHVLSQRPLMTGSGISLDVLIRLANKEGWDQAAAVGSPANHARPKVGGLDQDRIYPLLFAADVGQRSVPCDLPFSVPGMSDVMPYPSSVWSQLTPGELAAYRSAWRSHLEGIRDEFAPQLVHTNHLWLLSGIARQVFSDVPVVMTCHATGLRQLEQCPHLASEVIRSCRTINHFCVLRQDHRDQLANILELDPERISITGAGYREDLFQAGNSATQQPTNLLYVGKFSYAKGLPWLLDAVEKLGPSWPGMQLHIAGGGAGQEARDLAARMDAMAPLVVQHGQLTQKDLASLMRQCGICVLPSFYEGVPLVLVEAAASGCQIVATALPGVMEQLAPQLGTFLHLVALPGLTAVDQPRPEDLPQFTSDLVSALEQVLIQTTGGPTVEPPDLSMFTWSNVCQGIQDIWTTLLADQSSC